MCVLFVLLVQFYGTTTFVTMYLNNFIYESDTF